MAFASATLTGGSTSNSHAIEIHAFENSWDVGSNTSRVSAIARLVHTGGSPGSWGGGASWNIERMGAGGGVVKNGVTGYDFRNNLYGWQDLGSGEMTVTHNSDGTGSVTVRASFVSDHLGNASATITIPLTTIPRTSNSSFTGGNTLTAGTAVTINTNRASTSFTHKIEVFFGSISQVLSTNAGASLSWTPPLSFMAQIPNDTQGQGTLRTTTYAGSSYIGVSQFVFTLKAPASLVPTISSLTATDGNPTVASIVGTWVQNLSIFKATVNAAGAQGSTIKTRTFKMNGITVASGGKIAVTSSGNVPVTASVTDSRGRTAAWSGSYNVLAYAPPKVTKAQVRRSNASGTVSDSGTSLRIDLTASVSSLVNGTQRNTLTVRVFTRPVGGSVWTARNVISHSSLAYNTYFVVSGGANYPIDDSFDVRIDVIDKFKTSSAQTVVATARIFMHWSKTGVGIGKFHERGVLDVQGDLYASGHLYTDQELRASSHANIGGNLRLTGTMTSGAVPNARLTELSPGLTISTFNPGPPDNDLNKATSPGYYQAANATLNKPPGMGHGTIEVSNSIGRSTQIAMHPYALDKVWKRWLTTQNGTDWTDWQMVADERWATFLPRSMAAGSVNHGAVPARGGVTVTVTLPSGRFSVAPIIQATAQNAQTLTFAPTSVSASSFSLRASNWLDAASSTGSIGWTAIQMTEGAAAG